jgi:N-acetyltransferase
MPHPDDICLRFPLVKSQGDFVALELLVPDHQQEIIEAFSDGQLWNLNVTNVPRPEQVNDWIQTALSESQTCLPLVIRRLTDRKLVGSTRLFAIDLANLRGEIGHTALSQSVWRSPVNTQTKLLLLTHAFETMNFNAVELRTHVRNDRSRRAIERLGASLDGILRHHRIMPDGHLRDTCVYSILKNEWPDIKAKLTPTS